MLIRAKSLFPLTRIHKYSSGDDWDEVFRSATHFIEISQRLHHAAIFDGYPHHSTALLTGRDRDDRSPLVILYAFDLHFRPSKKSRVRIQRRIRFGAFYLIRPPQIHLPHEIRIGKVDGSKKLLRETPKELVFSLRQSQLLSSRQ